MSEHDIGWFLYDYLANEVEEIGKRKIPDYIRRAAFQLDYSKNEVYDTLRWILNEWRMNLANEDWNAIYERRGLRGIHDELNLVASGICDFALDATEKDFGYSQESSNYPPDIPALGKKLWDFIQRQEDSFFAQFNQDVRASEFMKAKALIRQFNNDILTWIKIELMRAGFR